MAIVSAPLGFNICPDTDRFSKCIVLGGINSILSSELSPIQLNEINADEPQGKVEYWGCHTKQSLWWFVDFAGGYNYWLSFCHSGLHRAFEYKEIKSSGSFLGYIQLNVSKACVQSVPSLQ